LIGFEFEALGFDIEEPFKVGLFIRGFEDFIVSYDLSMDDGNDILLMDPEEIPLAGFGDGIIPLGFGILKSLDDLPMDDGDDIFNI
jgi:hypothetical protein